MKDKIKAYKVLVGSLKRRLGRPKYRCEANNKMDFKEIRWEGIVWINVDENRGKWLAFLTMVMSLLVLYVGNFLTRFKDCKLLKEFYLPVY